MNNIDSFDLINTDLIFFPYSYFQSHVTLNRGCWHITCKMVMFNSHYGHVVSLSTTFKNHSFTVSKKKKKNATFKFCLSGVTLTVCP